MPEFVAETATWIDPDGTATVLDPDWDVSGRGLPPAVLDEFTVPLQPGSVLRRVTDGPRDHPWVLWLTAGTQADLWTQRRNLLYAMDPGRGQGTLRVRTVAGDTREIGCIVVDGLGVVGHVTAGGGAVGAGSGRTEVFPLLPAAPGRVRGVPTGHGRQRGRRPGMADLDDPWARLGHRPHEHHHGEAVAVDRFVAWPR
jgi:hypothetical protein